MSDTRRQRITPLAPDQRRELETLLRHQIAAVRTTCALLGRPSPIVGREERRNDTKEQIQRS